MMLDSSMPIKNPPKEENDLPFGNHPFVVLCTDVFDKEFNRLTLLNYTNGTPGNEAQVYVTAWFLDKYVKFKPHTYFTMENMVALTTEVFENVHLREFIFAVTEKVASTSNTGNFGRLYKAGVFLDYIENLIESLTDTHGPASGEAVMAPPGVAQSMELDVPMVEKALKSNAWYVFLYVLFMYMEETITLPSLLSKQDNKSERS